MSGKLERKMANCPSAVPGAVTRIAPTADGVDVTVTAPDPDAEHRIAELAAFQAHPPAAPFAGPHSGQRTGSSRIGFCPIVHRGATITTTRVPGGVLIHLRADSPSQVKALQDLISARAAGLPGVASS